MSDITSDVQETIDKILRLTNDDNAVSLTSACKDYLCTKIFPGGELKPGISTTVIPRVLSTILKCFDYDDPVLQQEGAFFIDAIASTPNSMQHSRYVIEKGVIPLLIGNLLPSTEGYVLDQTLACLGKIAARCPRDVIENGILQPLHECLKSKDRKVYFQAVRCLAILLSNCQEKVYDFLNVKVKTIEALIKIVESHGRNGGPENRYSLANLLSLESNDATLGSLKAIFDWLLEEKIIGLPNNAPSKPSERKIIKLLALKFIKNVVCSDVGGAFDIFIRENFIPSFLHQLYGTKTFHDIKNKFIKLVNDIVAVKPDFLRALIDEHNILSLLYSNLGSGSIDLLIASLTALKNIIIKFDDEEVCRQKFAEILALPEYTENFNKLLGHKNMEIRNLSMDIYHLVLDGDDDVRILDDECVILDSDGNHAAAAIERHQSRQPHKRPATAHRDERPLTRKKKSKTSNESDNNEHSDSSAIDDNDIGDHPGSSSPLNLDTVAAPAETNLNTFSVRQSIVASAGDGTTGNGSNTGHQSPRGSDDDQVTGPPTSNVPISVPEIAQNLNEIQLPLQPPRLQSPDHQNAAAAAVDEMPPNTMNPRNERSTSGNLSRSSSRHSSIATNHGTPSRIEMQPPLQLPRLQSPDHLNAATAAADEMPPNALNPRSERSASRNLSRSSSRNSSTATNHGTSSRHPRVKEESPSSNFYDPPSPTRPSNSPGLPVGSSTDGRNQSPSHEPSPASLQFSAGTSRNNNYFAPFRYFYPGEEFMSKCCETFGLKYYRFRQKILDFVKKINIHQHVDITSKPLSHPTNDETGFGCISMLFTGTENNAEIIRKQINANFVKLFEYDQKKFTTVINSSFLLKEHLETICRWLECRVMVYYNEKWELYGDWNSAYYQKLPLFLLEKKTIKEIYQVVLSDVIDLE